MSVSDGGAAQPAGDAAPSGRVPLGHKLLYGMGYLPIGLTTMTIMTWLAMRYFPPESATESVVLITGMAFGAATILGRVVDAIADPLLGYWSDRVHTRWGRRKPFIVIGAPLLTLAFVLVWTPPVQTGVTVINAIYLAFTASLFFFAFTVVVCPYLAMLPEITADPGERVSLASWQGGFNVVGTICGAFLAGVLAGAWGYGGMALAFAPVVLLCVWATVLVPTPVQADKPSDLPLRQAILSTLRNPWFPPYVVSQLLFWLALSMVLLVVPQITIVRAGVSEDLAGAPPAAALIVAGLCFTMMRGLAARLSKRRLLMGGMVCLGVLMVPMVLIGALPLPIDAFWQAVVIMALAGPSVAALFALPNAMVADIVDHDTELTGQRREAIYFGVQGLMTKIGMGVGPGIAVVLLGALGNDATRQGGFVACLLVAMALAWVAAAALTRYQGD